MGVVEVGVVDNTYTTAAQVTGKLYANDFAAPLGWTMASATLDKDNAFADAMSRPRSSVDPKSPFWMDKNPATDGPNLNIKTWLGKYLQYSKWTEAAWHEGLLSNMVLTAGVYTWTTESTVTVGDGFTLKGSACDVFIFQIKGSGAGAARLNVLREVKLVGVQPENVYWVVDGIVTIGDATGRAYMKGTILASKQITFQVSSQLLGRAFSKTAVTMVRAEVIMPPGLVLMSRPGPPKPTVDLPQPLRLGANLRADTEEALVAGSAITKESFVSAGDQPTDEPFPVLEVVVAVLGFLVLFFSIGMCYQRKMRQANAKTLETHTKEVGDTRTRANTTHTYTHTHTHTQMSLGEVCVRKKTVCGGQRSHRFA
jgi:hypothetical protein